MNSEESPGADANGTPPTSARSAPRAADVARNIARGLKGLAPVGVHPALIPGVGVEQTQRTYRTDWLVFGVAAAFTVLFIGWGVLDGEVLGLSQLGMIGVVLGGVYLVNRSERA